MGGGALPLTKLRLLAPLYSEQARLTRRSRVMALSWSAASALLSLSLLSACQHFGSADPVGAVESFSLIDAATAKPITPFDPLVDGATLNLAALPTKDLDVAANTARRGVGSVRFMFGGESRITSDTPYRLGAARGAAGGWTPPLGHHALSATPYPQAAAEGQPGPSLDIAFNVVDETPARPDEPLLGAHPPTLLARYYVLQNAGVWQRNTLGMMYRPRQYRESPYEGWDVLEVPGDSFRSYTRPDWLYVTLTRPATLVVVWRGPTPGAWLEDWQEVPEVSGGRAFRQVFPAGEVVLGAIGGLENDAYTVLLAEADGSPAAPPEVPAGLETPQPNAACPTWAHDQYMTQGHDGKLYRTWHPQIDPVYWCYFGHSHGSDPALFSGEVPVTFNYYADKGHRNEPHEGFKVFVVNTDAYSLLLNVHLGSSEAARICARIHAYDIALADRQTGEVLADLRLKADFGYTVAIDENSVLYRLKSAECPDMAALPDEVGGRVRIPIAGTSGYEPWNPSFTGDLVGISNPPVPVIDDPMTQVVVARSAAGSVALDPAGFATYQGLRVTGQSGARHWLSFPGGDVGRGFALRAADAAATGVFYTDYRGLKLLGPSDPYAVRQFIKPGLDFFYSNDKIVFTQDAWQNAFETAAGELLRVEMNLEGSLTSPN